MDKKTVIMVTDCMECGESIEIAQMDNHSEYPQQGKCPSCGLWHYITPNNEVKSFRFNSKTFDYEDSQQKADNSARGVQ